MSRFEKIIWIFGTTLVGGFILLQLLPVWRVNPTLDPRNPPVRVHIDWKTPESARLMHGICYTCHSNETEYPIYMQLAPLSWIAAEHVNDGRAHLNFSEQKAEDINPNWLISVIQDDVMPPQAYRLTHPEANLTPQEKAALIEGIRATLGKH
jgi:hypothetical protein